MTSGVIETVEIIDPWIYSTLSGDSALTAIVGNRLISTLAQEGVPAPYVQWFLASEADITVVGGVRIQVDTIYTVKGVSEGASWTQVRNIARRLDALLHRPGQTITTATGNLTSIRAGIIQYPEVAQATQFRHLGMQVRIRANPL